VFKISGEKIFMNSNERTTVEQLLSDSNSSNNNPESNTNIKAFFKQTRGVKLGYEFNFFKTVDNQIVHTSYKPFKEVLDPKSLIPRTIYGETKINVKPSLAIETFFALLQFGQYSDMGLGHLDISEVKQGLIENAEEKQNQLFAIRCSSPTQK
jgi:hypothetical protein